MSMFTIAGAPTIEEGDMELIFSQTVTSGTLASFSTGTLATGFKGLIIDTVARTDSASGVGGSFTIQINGDTTASNYQTTYTVGTTSVSSFVYTQGFFSGHNTGGAGAGFYQAYRSRLLGHEGTSNYKTWNSQGTGHGSTTSSVWYSATYAGTWKNTDAITSIVLVPASGELVTGSSIAVYGLK